MIEHVRHAYRLGLHFFPCRPGDKRPASAHGHLDARHDQAVLREAWRRSPMANPAIACAASGVVVIDVDPESPAGDGRETLSARIAELGELPDSWRVVTPRGPGAHLYFAAPNVQRMVGTLGRGVDVKWKGYVMAVGARHPNGGVYVWDAGYHPDDVPLAELPPSWIAALTDGPQRTDVQPSKGNASTSKLGKLLAARGMLGTAAKDGAIRCRCPFAASHSDKGRGPIDSSCVVFAGAVGFIRCQHGSCAARSQTDFLERLLTLPT